MIAPVLRKTNILTSQHTQTHTHTHINRKPCCICIRVCKTWFKKHTIRFNILFQFLQAFASYKYPQHASRRERHIKSKYWKPKHWKLPVLINRYRLISYTLLYLNMLFRAYNLIIIRIAINLKHDRFKQPNDIKLLKTDISVHIKTDISVYIFHTQSSRNHLQTIFVKTQN